MMGTNKTVLTTNSAGHFHLNNGKLKISRFPDGEIKISLAEDITNKEVIIIGSTQQPSENIMELVMLIDLVLLRSAKAITVIIPYFGYARADKENNTMVKVLETVAREKCRFIVLDPHHDDLKEYFTSPFKQIDANSLLAENLIHEKDLTIVAPDLGAREKAESFTKETGALNMVTVEKKRLTDSKVKLLSVMGNITSTAVIVDDIVATGNTVLESARILKEKGAKKIYVAVTHMVYSAGGWKKLAKSALIDKVFTTDSIAPPKNLPKKFKLISLVPVLKQLL